MSVYTHLTDHWAGWLLEHHRVLAEDGLLLVSFLALRHQVRQLQDETRSLRAQNRQLQDSVSWRLTAPLRRAKGAVAQRGRQASD